MAIIDAKMYRLGEALDQLAQQLHDENHTVELEGQGGELPSNFLGNKKRPDAGRIKPNRYARKLPKRNSRLGCSGTQNISAEDMHLLIRLALVAFVAAAA